MVTTRSRARAYAHRHSGAAATLPIRSPHFLSKYCKARTAASASLPIEEEHGGNGSQPPSETQDPRPSPSGRCVSSRRKAKRSPQRSKYFSNKKEEQDDAMSEDGAASLDGIRSKPRRTRRTAMRSKAATATEGGDADAEGQTPRTVHGLERSATFYGLIQELVSSNVFRLLVATCLLNQTRGRAAIPVFWDLLSLWPDEHALAGASVAELTELLQPLGLHNIRARLLIEMSTKMVEVPHDPANRFKARSPGCPLTPVGLYPGVGRYAIDSYCIFIVGGGAQQGLGGERPIAPAELRLREQLDRHLRLDVSGGGSGDGKGGSSNSEPAHLRSSSSAPAASAALDATIHQLTVVGTKVECEGEAPEDRRTTTETKAKQQQQPPPAATIDESEGPEWKKVLPLHKELRAYLVWRCAKEGIEWHPERGPLLEKT